VLARTLRRLADDYRVQWGQPVVAVETFVDSSTHRGTCYIAGGFELLGRTAGYRRSGGRWFHHGNTKLVLMRTLRRDARRLLSADFDHPALAETNIPMIDLERLCFAGLLERLAQITDHRKRRGVRHPLASLLGIAVAATLAGARNITAIGEFAADCPQPVLEALGAKYHPRHKRFIAPHTDTFRRALSGVDADRLDEVVGAWLLEQVRNGRIDEQRLILALDGKSMRGAVDEQGRAVHLFAAMVHGEAAVIAQQQVDTKTNEISAFRSLLADLDLKGALVTADAMHTHRANAAWLVETKQAHYLLQVKANQPSVLEACRNIPDAQFGEVFEHTERGHGRIETREVRVAPAPDGLFPYAKQVIVVYRERSDLDGRMTSSETSYYLTSIATQDGDAQLLAGHVRGHWQIENRVHWVRDWSFDEDRHQLRAAASPARALATLRNLTMSLLRLAGVDNIASALRWIARDPHRSAALLGV
jgi:predicted transposase YbfD/YdcC